MLAWIPRFTGLVSLLASSLILWDVLKDAKKRRSVYHQLMLGFSLFDMVSSIAFAFSTLPIPINASYYDKELPSGIYGAKGNDATCTAQGFFMELGFVGSMCYNITLSVYYLKVIVHGLSEREIKKLRLWMHAVPLILSFGLACAGIPFYESAQVLCHLPPPPKANSWIPAIILTILPVCTVIVVAHVNMGRIYLHARKRANASRRWQFEVGDKRPAPRLSLDRMPSVENLRQSLRRMSSVGSRSQRTLVIAGNTESSKKEAGQRIGRAVLWQAAFCKCC